jgi:hypothetical protein
LSGKFHSCLSHNEHSHQIMHIKLGDRMLLDTVEHTHTFAPAILWAQVRKPIILINIKTLSSNFYKHCNSLCKFYYDLLSKGHVHIFQS